MNANIAGFLRASAQRHPDAACIVVGRPAATPGPRSTAPSTRSPPGWCSAGCMRGTASRLLLGNSYEFVVAYFGAARAGLVSVPLNPAYTSAEVAVLLADSGARMLVVQPSTEQVGEESAAALPGCEVVSVAGPEWAEILQSGEGVALAEVAQSPDALALLLFTAGTSGRPRARCSRTAPCAPTSRCCWRSPTRPPWSTTTSC